MNFEEGIKKWVQKDNQIKLYLEKLRELRAERGDLTSSLFQYAEENDLGKIIVEITDGKLRFQETKTSLPLTLKFVKQCLDDCIEDSKHVEQIMNYIKEKRGVRFNSEIKRITKKN